MSSSAIRETIGLISVVGSLIFVGLQIRQTNEIARQQSLRQIEDMWLSTNVELLVDERLSELQESVRQGAREADFDDADRFSLHLLFYTLNKGNETKYRELSLGLLSRDDYQFPAEDDPFWNSDFHRDIWPQNRAAFTNDFAEFWERRFGLIP